MRKFLVCLFLFCLPVSALAQITTVTGTITDPNGVPYAGGTIKAQLTVSGSSVGQPTVTINNQAQCQSGGFGSAPCQVPFQGTMGPISLDQTGSFTLNLQDNTQVTPSGSKWTFTFGISPGAALPIGTGPQTSPPIPVTISGTSQNISTLLSSAAPKLSNISANNPSGTISPLTFGAKWDVKFIGDAQWNLTTSTITCPSNDCNFTTADIGKIIFGTNCTAQINPSMLSGCGVSVPQGTITAVASSTSITVSTTTTNSCTASSAVTCNIAWGTQIDTAAINAAATAAFNTPGSNCALQFPAGAAFIDAAILNGPGNNRCWQGAAGQTAIADLTSVGPAAFGACPGCTVIIPVPSFNFGSCTGGLTSNACIGGLGNLHLHDFSIFGLGNPVGGTQSVILVASQGTAGGGNCDGGTTMWNMSFSAWAWNTANSIGLQLANNSCNDPVYWNDNISAFGANPLNLVQGSGGQMSLTGIFAWGGSSYTVTMNFNGTINSNGSQYYGPLSTNIGIIQCQGTNPTGHFVSKGDAFRYANGTRTIESIAVCNVGSQFFDFESDFFQMDSGTSSTGNVFLITGGNTVHLKNSNFTVAGTNNRLIFSGSTDQYFDDGGNTYGTLPSVNSVIAGDFIADGHSVKAKCTGTATASQTLGLYGTGPNETLTTCTSTTIGSGIPIPGARTLEILRVVAATGGVNASSGVVTVLRNGVATAITCTLGTGTACVDATHSVVLSDGDLISIQFTTQAGETLAGVNAIVEWN